MFAGSVAGATLAALYRRTRMLLYVPLVEGFGLPPLEAMYHGTPVVASRVPSTAGAALEVEPTDVAAITEAIVEVATVPSVRRRLAGAGAAHARTLTWRQAAPPTSRCGGRWRERPPGAVGGRERRPGASPAPGGT